MQKEIDTERLQLLLKSIKPAWFSHLYPEQAEVAYSTSLYKAITVPRQTGKTTLLTALAVDGLERAQFNECVMYLAKTEKLAVGLIWSSLVQASKQLGLNWSFDKSNHRIETPRGGYLLVRGAEGNDPLEHLDTLRGHKCRRILLDEPATYQETLDLLLSQVLEPATHIPQGDIIIAGTPGYMMTGPWYEISTGRAADPRKREARKKWKRFHWSGDKNPSRTPGYLERVKLEKGLTDEDPEFQVEWLGLWCASDALQVYRFVDSRNGVDSIPDYDISSWIHTIGVDFGMSDECAWTVLASHPHRRETYVIESFKSVGKGPEEAAVVTNRLCEKYNPAILVGDGKNLGGNIYIDAFNERYPGASSQMIAADKNEKRAYIELLNQDLRSSKLLFLRDSTGPLTTELLHLPWQNSQRKEEHKSYDNHCADAMLYAWRHHYAYCHTNSDLGPGYDQQDLDADDGQLRKEIEQALANQSTLWWAK